MRIAMITETFLPSTDGVVTRLCASIRWLRSEGHEVMVIAPDHGIKEYEGAIVAGIPAYNFFLYKEDRKFSFYSKKVKKYLKTFNPDIVHAVNPSFLGVTGIYYAKRLKLPLMASYHTHVPKYADYYNFSYLKPAMWTYFKTLHNRASLNLCTSNTVLGELREKGFRNVHLWKRGVDTKQFHPGFYSEEMRERLTGGKTDKTLLIFVSRLAAEKEIERVKPLLTQSDDYCLAIVGDGPNRETLEKEFAGTNTIFTGFMHGEELAQAYASSDVFVFPSTTETLGLVLMEAMASGLPVLAAKSGPTAEQVADGETGVLFDPADPAHILRAAAQLKIKEVRAKMGQRAHEEIQSVGWDESAAQLMDYYYETLSVHKESSKK
ncbi:glycosyltransferase family 4 protein [Jeotgalibacillus haloalkalitolerans]|uniref:Glycosyltransferase family 1 protein n=1 Tax=Jeotgalibacillus haloalkalitolerans TaxID=3104292 RepID=A0ABU5KI91_9BACL|nr:glycosyltransferase family 1 protein [Jeotgalibacillus sp. HH7-29]MDZ5710948.1 glycosyltransferase family 1 protein [Jeotgalibacillus sp. HH7-29]